MSLLSTYLWPEGDIVDANYQTDQEHTALFYAAAWGFRDICRMLLEKGANRHLQDNERRVAADVANSRQPPPLLGCAKLDQWQFSRPAKQLGMPRNEYSGHVLERCDCISYGHGVDICRFCFGKGKRCKDLQPLTEQREGCINKRRFYKGGLLSYSELWQLMEDLKDPKTIQRDMSDLPTGIPDQGKDEGSLEHGIANPSEPSTASKTPTGIPPEPTYAEEPQSATASDGVVQHDRDMQQNSGRVELN
ncbi:hypothetical protein EV426DRAFT_711729 [Tirmania nivea]|nr:hypothetical protein EV426DRAFT_711729 [Tirmania nivea]